MIKKGIDLYVEAEKYYKAEEYSKDNYYFFQASKVGNFKAFRRIGDLQPQKKLMLRNNLKCLIKKDINI